MQLGSRIVKHLLNMGLRQNLWVDLLVAVLRNLVLPLPKSLRLKSGVIGAHSSAFSTGGKTARREDTWPTPFQLRSPGTRPSDPPRRTQLQGSARFRAAQARAIRSPAQLTVPMNSRTPGRTGEPTSPRGASSAATAGQGATPRPQDRDAALPADPRASLAPAGHLAAQRLARRGLRTPGRHQQAYSLCMEEEIRD